MGAGGPPLMAPQQADNRSAIMSNDAMPPQQGPLPGSSVPPTAPGGIPPQPQPYRQLKVEDALAYLDQVKMKFEKQPHIYNKFLDIMKEFKAQSIDTPGVIDRVLQLFHGHRELILGFNTFLPPGYKIEFSDDENKPRVQLKYPQGMTGPQPQGFAAMQHPQPPPAAPMAVPPPNPLDTRIPTGPTTFPIQTPPLDPPVPGPAPPGPGPAPQAKKAPIEFDQAINYVTKIKTRFSKQPDTYKAFLEILHTYQKEQKTIKEVYEQVSTLFKNHTDLLNEFSQFLPDGSPEAGGLLGGPKGAKGKGLGGLMGGQLGGLKQPVAQRPSANKPPGAVIRQGEEEEERYWQKRKNGAAGRKEEGGKRADAVARSPEAEFFSKCRNRMPKPLYLELLKCLNLYSQQIIDRSELLTLVHDLFKRSQIELFGTFRRLLGYTGGTDVQRDAPSPPAQSQAPMAEGGNFRDLDFTTMRRQGTSYRILPDSYSMPTCSGRGPLETLVLNDTWVSVATGTEDLNFKTMRKNQYEESIFRAEDERFELDTTIETNSATIQLLQPIAAEIAGLSEQEKRRYKLSPLSAMHCKSIRRLYGAQGTQVIELMHKCPAAAVGALVTRLQQKDEEWRALRAQCSKTWKEVYEKNYTKSLDHRSFYFKQGDKKNFSGKQMVIEVKALTEITEAPEVTEGTRSETAAAAAAAANAANAGEAAAMSAAGPSASSCLTLPFTVSHSKLSTLHDDTLALMTFAAKLNFSVVEGEIDEKLRAFWDAFVRKFFVCPESDAGKGEATDGDEMQVDESRGTPPKKYSNKPLVIVSADGSEENATRDARPPDSRWAMPLNYPKTSNQLFIGNSHFYIFVRLYHIVIMRLDSAREMASKQQQQEADAGSDANGADKADSSTNGIGAMPSASADQQSRQQLLESIRQEAKGDIYVAFLSCLRQLIDGKMEASTYEDVLRTLLGTNAYILFTLHKIVSQALKQLQMLLVEEASQNLLELYEYERHRAAPGAFSESTYRSNARMVLEGDDCFAMEQLYSAGVKEGGALVLAFLPEREQRDGDDDDGEEDDDEEEEEADEAGKAESVAYMQSFAHSAASTSLARAGRSRLLLKRTMAMRKRVWDKTVLRNGLECRAAVGSCKLRFVTRSEDIWFANGLRTAAKRASSHPGGGTAKRRKLKALFVARDGGPNVLAGQPPPTPAPLPRAHKLKPSEPTA